MTYDRNKVIEVMNLWLGATTGSTNHKNIVNIYNSNKKLPRGYKLKLSDAWCAATVSAASIALGYEEIIPCECSCGKMIDLLKAKDEWVEDDSYIPAVGDIIFYYWDDSGIGDCNAHASHVGFVESCDGKYITAIEGNYNGRVAKRKIAVNGRFIRGFGVPKYSDHATDTRKFYVAKKGDSISALIKKGIIKDKATFIKDNKLSYPYWLYAGRTYLCN